MIAWVLPPSTILLKRTQKMLVPLNENMTNASLWFKKQNKTKEPFFTIVEKCFVFRQSRPCLLFQLISLLRLNYEYYGPLLRLTELYHNTTVGKKFLFLMFTFITIDPCDGKFNKWVYLVTVQLVLDSILIIVYLISAYIAIIGKNIFKDSRSYLKE